MPGAIPPPADRTGILASAAACRPAARPVESNTVTMIASTFLVTSCLISAMACEGSPLAFKFSTVHPFDFASAVIVSTIWLVWMSEVEKVTMPMLRLSLAEAE